MPSPSPPESSAPPCQRPINTVEGPCVGAHHIPAITISRGPRSCCSCRAAADHSWRISQKMKSEQRNPSVCWLIPHWGCCPRLSWDEGGSQPEQTNIHPHSHLRTDNLLQPRQNDAHVFLEEAAETNWLHHQVPFTACQIFFQVEIGEISFP